MIQFNLLPDVKVQFIKTRRISRLVFLGSILVTTLAMIATVSIYLRAEAQESKLGTLTEEATSIFNKIRHAEITALDGQVDAEITDINELLTIQTQLGALTELHEEKLAAERVEGYLEDILPEGVEIIAIRFDFEENIFTLGGNISSGDDSSVTDLELANVLIDTIIHTQYQIGDEEDAIKKRVFLLKPSNLNSEDGGVSFSLTGSFDPVIFDSQIDNIRIIVPNIDSTHKQTESAGGN